MQSSQQTQLQNAGFRPGLLGSWVDRVLLGHYIGRSFDKPEPV